MPVAWRAARTMASATTSAASAPTRLTSAAPACAPVASAKMVSPSPGVWLGVDARARSRRAPSARPCVACVLVSVALVATTPSVVFSPSRAGCLSAPDAQQRARVGERLAVRRAHAGDDFPGRGIDHIAGGVDRDQRRDDQAVGQRESRRCRCRPSSRGRSRASCRPWRRRRRRRCPRPPAPSSGLRARCSRSRRSAGSSDCRRRCRSKRIAAGTIGTLIGPNLKPMFCSSRYRMTPDAAVEAERAAARQHDRVRPAAPGSPDSADRFRACRRGAAHVDAGVAPASARITVQPVGRSVSVWWPTLMPGTAVSVWLPGLRAGADRRRGQQHEHPRSTVG